MSSLINGGLIVCLFLFVVQLSRQSSDFDAGFCDHQERNENVKFDNTSLVVIAKFVGLRSNGVSTYASRIPVDYAEVLVHSVHKKGTSDSHVIPAVNSTLILPLYKNSDKFSRRKFCLNEKLLNVDDNYMFFLNDRCQSTSIVNVSVCSVRYIPVRLPNKKMHRILFQNKMSAKLDEIETPVYEILVDTDAKEEDQAFKRAKALIGDPLFVKCRVQGEVHVEPSMMWYVDGAPITVTDDKLIETNLKELSSTLKIARFEYTHRGHYECSVKAKSGLRKRAKIKVDIKSNNYTTLFNEELCSSELDSYCKHDGICLVHKDTNFVSCKCAEGYYGHKCEFADTGVHLKTAQPVCVEAKVECHRTMLVIGCLTAVAIVSLFVALLFIMRHRSKKDKGTTCSQHEVGSLRRSTECLYLPSLVDSNGSHLLPPKNVELEKLMPRQSRHGTCSNCGRDFVISNSKIRSQSFVNDANKKPVHHPLTMPRSATNFAVDPDCRICRSELKKTSLPGFMKVSDVDGSGRSEHQSLPPVPQKVREGKDSKMDYGLLVPRKSFSTPVTPSGSMRQMSEAVFINGRRNNRTHIAELPSMSSSNLKNSECINERNNFIFEPGDVIV